MLASTSALLIRPRGGVSPKEGSAIEPMPFQVRWRPRAAIVSLGLAQSKGRANTRGTPTGNGHEQENRRNDKREQLDRTRQGGDARYREAGYVLQIAVDHELTVEAYDRTGQTTRAQHEYRFGEEDATESASRCAVQEKLRKRYATLPDV